MRSSVASGYGAVQALCHLKTGVRVTY